MGVINCAANNSFTQLLIGYLTRNVIIQIFNPILRTPKSPDRQMGWLWTPQRFI